MKLDRIDRKILTELIENARMPIVALAQKVGLSKSPCQRRVRLLEEAGLIRRYTVDIDTAKAGINVTVFATVEFAQLAPEAIEVFEDFVQKADEVAECYVTTGDSDFLIKIVAPDFEHYEQFLKTKLLTLPGIRRINTIFAYRKVKSRITLPLSLSTLVDDSAGH